MCMFRFIPRTICAYVFVVSFSSIGHNAFGQTAGHEHPAPAPGQGQQQAPAPAQGATHEHPAPATAASGEAQHAAHEPEAAGNSMMREGSGTSWLPDQSPMYALHRESNGWMLMLHHNLFLQYLDDAGDRGLDQFGSINWVMGMAHRPVGQGRFGVRGMFSLEPWTINGCGYPDLLASGEVCEGDAIHDQQHPHDLVMELSASYDQPVVGSMRWQIYGGLAGEPALGPVAFPHRVSAWPNPVAPITHHWLDSTHITFGVVTGAVYGGRWKAEGSVFNGREPDEERTNVDLAVTDSFSGRFSFLPNANVALQVSAGHLEEAEPAHGLEPARDVNRVTASATYHRRLLENGIWATTVGWGRNAEGESATNALLLETNLTFDDEDTWFGRFEVVGKTTHDLDVPGPDQVFTVSKLQGGFVRYFDTWNGLKPGVGISVSTGIVPGSLRRFYGSRTNAGLGVFVTLRPAAMRMSVPQPLGAGRPSTPPIEAASPARAAEPAPRREAGKPEASDAGDPRLPVIPAERIIDPACARTIDLTNAPRATYQGKVYYFCSTADREAFLKDPEAYLKTRVR